MDMASAARMNTWNDRLQPITALIIGKLMATQAKARVIVFAAGIRVPEIECHSATPERSPGHHQTRENQVAPVDTWFEQGTPFRRGGLK